MIDNLTEAISHTKEVAENLKEIASTISVENEYDKRKLAEYLDCIKNNEQLAKWLEELAERREADRWIPVTERLPEEYGNYLVFTSDNDIDIGTFNPRFEDSWSMCDANGFYWVRQKGIEITHWKSLPKFYESEDK